MVLVSVREIKKHKGVIKVLPELINYWYVLYSCGRLLDECREMVESLGVSERFMTTEYRTDVANFHNIADAFVFTS